MVGDEHLDPGSVDEPMCDHLVDGAWVLQKLEHRLMTASDGALELVEHFNEVRTSLHHAFVMERDVEVGVLVAYSVDAVLEVIEIAEDIAVVRAKAGEVDIGEEEDAVGNAEPAVANRMPGQVDRLNLDAAKVPHRTVLIADGIGSRRVVERREIRVE